MLQDRHVRTNHALQRGMTLLEIMIVVAILGMLASVVVIGVMNSWRRAQIDTTKLKITNVNQTLHKYAVAHRAYPSQQDGLHALISPQDGGKPFFDEGQVPKDAWGNELMYFSPPKRGDAPFEVVSKGPDGQLETEDDIRADQ